MHTKFKVAKPPCSVCGEKGNGIHFGAEACRACAAFFRRSVAMNRKYVCRDGGGCNVISTTVRCSCRHCRFEKCLAVGMKKQSVEKFVDTTGMPILSVLIENYMKLEKTRRVVHKTSAGGYAKNSKALTYKEAEQVHMKEFDLVAEWVTTSFPEFAELGVEQMQILFLNFYLSFVILQGSYFACLQNRTDILWLASGDYIDCLDMQKFYYDPNGQQTLSSEDAAKIFTAPFSLYQRNVAVPMLEEKIDKFEFLAIGSLVLFDIGFDGQSDESLLLARRIRESIYREILYYYRNVLKIPEPSIRLAKILSFLPPLQRTTCRFREDIEISQMFNIYSIDDKLYEFWNSKF